MNGGALNLSRPVTVAEMRALTDVVHGWDDLRVELNLELCETALRAQFGIEAAGGDADKAMRRAILLGFESYLHQRRQLAGVSVGGEGYSYQVARTDALSITWPDAVISALREVMPEERPSGAAPSVTALVRK